MPLLGVIASFFASAFSRWVLGFLAVKVLLISLVVVVLPIVLNNVIYKLLSISLDFINANSSSLVEPSMMLQVSGMLGYLVVNLSIPQCISILLSAVAVRFTLRALRVL